MNEFLIYVLYIVLKKEGFKEIYLVMIFFFNNKNINRLKMFKDKIIFL